MTAVALLAQVESFENSDNNEGVLTMFTKSLLSFGVIRRVYQVDHQFKFTRYFVNRAYNRYLAISLFLIFDTFPESMGDMTQKRR